MLNKIIKPILNEAQNVIDKEYEEKGLTDEILDTQIKLNQIRNVLDIPDPNEKVYEEFVQ